MDAEKTGAYGLVLVHFHSIASPRSLLFPHMWRIIGDLAFAAHWQGRHPAILETMPTCLSPCP